MYEKIPESTTKEEVEEPLPNVADFDSASGFMR